jgi:hypothetical protein
LATPDRKALVSEIEDLLEAGIDLDQVMILKSEEFSNQTIADYSKLLKSITRYAMVNAKRIQEARRLLLRLA